MVGRVELDTFSEGLTGGVTMKSDWGELVWRWATDKSISQLALASYGMGRLVILCLREETKLETLAITAPAAPSPPALPLTIILTPARLSSGIFSHTHNYPLHTHIGG